MRTGLKGNGAWQWKNGTKFRVTRLRFRCLCGEAFSGLVSREAPLRARCPRAADGKTHLDIDVRANQLHDDLRIDVELFHGFVQLGAAGVSP